MRVLIRTRGADGAFRESQADLARVTLGRATHCTVQLPGLMVALEHAAIGVSGKSRYRLESKAPVGVELNGRSGVRDSALAIGDELRIGGHRITIDPPPEGCELALTVEPAAAGGELPRAAARLDLHAAGLRQRRPALILALLVLLFGLAVPALMTALGRPEPARRVVPTDAFWVGGGVSDGHAHFAHRCETCHGAPFRAIDNEACLSCHANVAHHADDPAVLQLAGFAGRACVDCHKEHRGAHSLISEHPAQCTVCHAAPGKLGAHWASMPPASDFRDAHPPFRYTVNRLADDGTHWEETRVATPADGSRPKDMSGLLFPHDQHLAKEGVKSPDGRERLVCASCHTPDAAGAGFRDLDFEKHCQRCHRLELVTPERRLSLPHGQNDASRFLLEAFYVPAAQAAAQMSQDGDEGADNRRRAGAGREDAPTGTDRRQVVAEVFEYQLCGKCHIVDTSGEHPRVIPPQLRHTFLPAASFSHVPHQAVPCAKCHDVAHSDNGEDLNLPAIETCRTCHAGTHSREGVRSTCLSCHAMHRSRTLLMSGARADVGGLLPPPGTAASPEGAASLPETPR